MSYDYITRQDRELPFDDPHNSTRHLYKLNACSAYTYKGNIIKMLNAFGYKDYTKYTWFLYYFRKYTLNQLLLSIGAIILEGLEFVSFEGTMDRNTVFITTDIKFFYFYTGYGRFRINKEKCSCENFLMLELDDWKYLMGLDFFSRKFHDLALEASKINQLKTDCL